MSPHISLLDGPLVLSERVSAQLRELGAADVCVIGGGVILDEDKSRLGAKGVPLREPDVWCGINE